MSTEIFYILTPPDHPLPNRHPNLFPAVLSHRITPTGQLLKLNASHSPRDGVMVVCGCDPPPSGSPRSLCSALLRECVRHHPRGLLLDSDHPCSLYAQLLPLLSPTLSRMGITLFLPEHLACYVPCCRVLISSALSGGSLELRIKEAADQYGTDRIALCLESAAMEFLLPCPTGQGCPLTQEHLTALLREVNPHTHFSPALCTRYFTFFRAGQLHLVLYDDPACLREKYTCARRLGIFRFLLLQCNKSALFPDFSP